MVNEISQHIFNSPTFGKIKFLNGRNLFFTGVSGSLRSFIISYIYNFVNRKIIYCSNDKESLFRIKDDIDVITGNEIAEVYLNKYDEEYENEISTLSSVVKKLSSEEKFIHLFEPQSLETKIINEAKFKSNILRLNKSEEFSFDEIISRLTEQKYERQNLVAAEKDFAVRGGIIDIFPENLEQPVRIEFFGNKIDSIREFDLVTQRSISHLESLEILPSAEAGGTAPHDNQTLTDLIKDDVLILIDEPDKMIEENREMPGYLLKNPVSYFSIFPLTKSGFITLAPPPEEISEINFRSKSQPSFNSNVKLLIQDLKKLSSDDYKIYLTASDDYQVRRLKELIEEEDGILNLHYDENSVHSGFIFPEVKIAVYTEHEIFGRYYRAMKRKKARRWKGGLTFKELSRVNYGDYIVHRDYGIGKYAGLRKIKAGGIEQESLKLLYEDNDTLFVNLNSLHQIKKYSAQEGQKPKLSKLGGYEWERLKQRTKKKIQEIAKDLIELYAKRKHSNGFSFSPDAVWQKELEASFIYEDTPDQISATQEVKNDMESESPMDRLICGDVGFGKTEIAVRAAFKCTLDNKQTAVLVPTTILAEQHYNTFKDRLRPWAAETEHFSRFKTKKEQKEILKKLSEGKINIIIGTHRLLSKDVRFKDLGLLIVDEEQRFGVKAKEKIKMMKENVDVLTLTATPIPRTLNFSLLGARDLSIINTPPKNRQPIHTEIITFDRKIISGAITKELERGGQVYFVNDRISKLEDLASLIEELVQPAKVAIAHGQMKPAQLEKVMMKFLEKKYNVLLCTKIIESGLDIPSVNTIIINRADNFGLAELYQLRGRVGRSNIKAYAYLIAPPHSSLTSQAVRRLHALEEFSELGSGMNLALRDMEIRGAGNLLGRQQSGFISELGFETYMQILDEAVREIKQTSPHAPLQRRGVETVSPGTIVESDVSVLIPEIYIEDENTRLEIYRRLSEAKSGNEINEIRSEVADRFGKFPAQVNSLFVQIELKLLSSRAGFEKIEIKKNEAELYFDLKNEEIFRSGQLEKITKYLEGKKNVKLIQTKKSLILKYFLEHSDHSGEKLNEVKEILEGMLDAVRLENSGGAGI